MMGAPLEEEVEVRFGLPVDRNKVTVQLVASPSRSATPPPHLGSAFGARKAGQGTAGVGWALAAAACFVMESCSQRWLSVPSLFWGRRRTPQQAPGTRAPAVFWDIPGRGCMQKECVHAMLRPGTTMHSCSEDAWVRICATPMPVRSCMCVFPTVQSPIAAADRAQLHRGWAVRSCACNSCMQSSVCSP